MGNNSKQVYVPSAVSSFFEICDRNPDGSPIRDLLRVGSRGGGFVIGRGTTTRASNSVKRDVVIINEKRTSLARTTLKVVELMKRRYDLGPIKITHQIEPPIGYGFGTSGSGALGAAIAISDLFDLHLSLAQVSAFAHRAEVESVTGLGTVISLASGSGAVGLVTEPGSFSLGSVDSILVMDEAYALVCACFGPIEKNTVLRKESARKRINSAGHNALEAVLDNPTPENLLKQSRLFAEKSGIASPKLLRLADRAVELGAIGSTQNMIGNGVHALVRKERHESFVRSFSKFAQGGSIFVSDLIHSGPVIR